MKKFLITISAVALMLSFTGCAKEEKPSVEERAFALISGQVSVEEMEEKGWLDEELINWLDSNIDNLQNEESAASVLDDEKSSSYLGEFETVDLYGNEVKSDIFSEYDLTLVNLWTTNCGYCIKEMPHLEEIKNEFAESGKSFNIIGICLDINASGDINENKLEKAMQIIESTGVTYTNIIPDDVIWSNKAGSVSAVPESFFVDKDGKLVGKTILGAKDKEGWLSEIEEEFNELEGKV